MWYISFHCVHSCVFFGSQFATRYEQIETEIQDRLLILEVNRFSSQNKLGQFSKTLLFCYLRPLIIRSTEVIIDKCCVIHVLDVLQCLKHFLKHIKHGTIWDLISSFSKNDA